MSTFEKDKDLLSGKGEDDIEWITVKGSHIPIKKGENVHHFQDTNNKSSKVDKTRRNIVILDKQEYAELNSAIRTKYANSIPKEGAMLYGNNYYMFSYNKPQEKIVCRLKIAISGNEEKIRKIEEQINGTKQ